VHGVAVQQKQAVKVLPQLGEEEKGKINCRAATVLKGMEQRMTNVTVVACIEDGG